MTARDLEVNAPRTHFQRGDRHVYRRIAGEDLLVDMKSNAEVPYFLLTPTGVLLWERLQTWSTVDELAGMLCSEYEVGTDEARRDVIAFLEQLQAIGAVQDRTDEP